MNETLTSMERMKPNKIIAVDTSLGTNFLVSACDDATVSELRGLIQMGHLSCFPEHGSITVLALTVQYSQRQYHVTDSLLIGHIFRKSWNKIHAEVSSGSLRAASTLHSSKSAEAESLANGKAALDDTLVVKRAGSKGLVVDGESNEAPEHSSSPLVGGDKATKDLSCCNEMTPVMSNSQTSWINHRCPLLSMEAPYTQSHSQQNLATRATFSKEVLGKGHECKKRKCAEQEEILGRKRKQVEISGQIIHNFGEGENLSPGRKSAAGIKGDIDTQEQGFGSIGQQCKQDTLCRNGFSEEVAPIKQDALLAEADKEPLQALMKGDAQVAEAHKEPQTNDLQSDNIFTTNTCMADDSNLRKQSKGSFYPHLQAFVASPITIKPTSLSEKELATSEKEAANQAPDKARIEGGLSCPKVSTENEAQGMEDANRNYGERVSKMDFSMGYPIQLNDHSTLFVASLSADVVPETQESQLQSQDGMNAEVEEVSLAKRGLDGYEHAAIEAHSNCLRQDPMEPQEIEAQGLPSHKVTMNVTSLNLHNVEENLALLAETKETSYLKPSVVADAEKNNIGTKGAHTNKLDRQLHDTGLSGGNHDIPSIRKKKKRKRKKVSEIHKVSVHEDNRFIASGSKSQGTPGDREPKKDAARLLENPTESSYEKGGERVHMLDGQARTPLGNVNASNSDDDAHPKELERQNGTALNVDKGYHRESSCVAGEKRVAIREGVIYSSLKDQSGEKHIEGSLKEENCEATMQREMLCMEGTVTQAGTTRRKKKKRRKERPPPCAEGALGDNLLNTGNEGGGVPFSIKELPNVLRVTAMKEGGELCWNTTAKAVSEEVTKEKLEQKKKEMIQPDPNSSLREEQGEDNSTMDHAERKAFLRDRLVASSSTSSRSKECSQEGLVKTKGGFDVFDFESSETGNRAKEICKDNEVTSDSEANNLEKLCSAAVKLVEDEILSPSKIPTRKSNRKAVHPKRWITVLTERLTWNQTSKSNSKKKQRANKSSKPIVEGAGLPNNEEINPEPVYAKEEEERRQIIVDDRRVACPLGCGRLYTKKTSAYYRHSRMCSGGDYGSLP